MKLIETYCTVCGEEKPCKSFPQLYTIGSEGTHLCHACEMIVVELLRSMMNLSTRARKLGYRKAKKLS